MYNLTYECINVKNVMSKKNWRYVFSVISVQDKIIIVYVVKKVISLIGSLWGPSSGH